MANYTIKVSRIGQSNQLSLRQGDNRPGNPGGPPNPGDPGNDSLVTTVAGGDTLEWVVDSDPDSGRNSNLVLESVSENVSNTMLTEASPIEAVSGTISATVKQSSSVQGPRPVYDNYTIAWSEPGNPTDHFDDPRLKMN